MEARRRLSLFCTTPNLKVGHPNTSPSPLILSEAEMLLPCHHSPPPKPRRLRADFSRAGDGQAVEARGFPWHSAECCFRDSTLLSAMVVPSIDPGVFDHNAYTPRCSHPSRDKHKWYHVRLMSATHLPGY
jgi:hypothetical protein